MPHLQSAFDDMSPPHVETPLQRRAQYQIREPHTHIYPQRRAQYMKFYTYNDMIQQEALHRRFWRMTGTQAQNEGAQLV